MSLNVLTYLCNFCIYLGCQKPNSFSLAQSTNYDLKLLFVFYLKCIRYQSHVYGIIYFEDSSKEDSFFSSPFLVISGIILQWLRFVKTHHIYKKIKANFFCQICLYLCVRLWFENCLPIAMIWSLDYKYI